MVKNTCGGNKAKGQARKFISVKSKEIRKSKDEDEIYAQNIRTLGNGMCHVLCSDGITRLCHIRGKFRGRGKKDNLVKNNTWLLVGLREWDKSKEVSTKMQDCDLLEVYNDEDKEELKNIEKGVNWNLFVMNDQKTIKLNDNNINMDNIIEFSDSKTDEYKQLIEEQLTNKTTTMIMAEDEEEINIDDI
jgi:translation initiation factor 1A